MFAYAQLNQDNICIGVSELAGEVSEYNYTTEQIFDPITNTFTESEPKFVSRMISIPVYSSAYIGLRYNNEEWEQPV